MENLNEERGNERGTRDGSRNVCFTLVDDLDESGGWLIDSGSTAHMTGEIGRLKNVVPCARNVSLADGKEMLVRATGTSEFLKYGANGETIHVKLKNVFYVPGLTTNVISVSRMVDAGYDVCFGSTSCTIF